MKPEDIKIYFMLGLIVVIVWTLAFVTLLVIPWFIIYANENFFRSLGFVGSDLNDIKVFAGIIVSALIAAAVSRFVK